MEKITKKLFVETLMNNKSMFIGSYFKVEPERMDKALENSNVLYDETIERTVTAKKSRSLLFSNGSSLGFDQVGKYQYHSFNKGGLLFLIQEHITYNDFDQKYFHNWIIYAIKEGDE